MSSGEVYKKGGGTLRDPHTHKYTRKKRKEMRLLGRRWGVGVGTIPGTALEEDQACVCSTGRLEASSTQRRLALTMWQWIEREDRPSVPGITFSESCRPHRHTWKKGTFRMKATLLAFGVQCMRSFQKFSTSWGELEGSKSTSQEPSSSRSNRAGLRGRRPKTWVILLLSN